MAPPLDALSRAPVAYHGILRTGGHAGTFLPLRFRLAVWQHLAALEQELPADWRFWLSKAVHFSMYLLLFLLGTWGLGWRWRWRVVGLLLLHAGLTELVQTWVPHRHGSLRDVLIDSGGVFAGLLLSQGRRRTTSDAT